MCRHGSKFSAKCLPLRELLALRMWAEDLGPQDASKLLQETLSEEEATDKGLTKLAETRVNAAAM